MEASVDKEGELAAGTSVGDYRVERKLGQGGMGAVYLAEQVALGKRVAIKVLAPRLAAEPLLAQRFLNEALCATIFRNSAT